MKRTVVFFIVVLFSTSVLYAQGRDMRRADRSIDRGNLASALENLQAAMEHEEVFEDPEFWLLKARLYLQIAITDNPEYRELVENPVDKADEAMIKAVELDTDNQHWIQIQQNMLFLSEMVFNQGVDKYNQQNWGEASDYFLRAYEIGKTFEAQDTTTLYNAALSAELGQQYDKALDLYIRLRDMQYDQPFLYASLANISLFLGDTASGTKYVEEGRERYPDDLELIFTEANIHIFTGDLNRAEKILDIAIEKDPDNPVLYFALAANYDQMAQDTLYPAEKREFAFQEAISAYKQALEIDPNYFDAMFNLGALHFNKGLRLFEEAEERLRATHDFAQYEEDEKEIRKIWLDAEPYLQQALEMIEEDHEFYRTVLISLVELYARTNQPDKLKEIEGLYLKYFGEEE
ncbi:MAG: tetratricopeptide repeat protein [Bacteroidia bacterium]|nr:MAG: tetratricopeptide repeat protein [Bacteroidia bacterium]